MPRSNTPGPSWWFELILLACGVSLIAAALIAIFGTGNPGIKIADLLGAVG
jgi:hypothetical protein